MKHRTKPANYKAVFYNGGGRQRLIAPVYGRSQEAIIKSAQHKLYGRGASFCYDVLERQDDGTWRRVIVGARVW